MGYLAMRRVSDRRWIIAGAFALVYVVWGSTYLAVALAVHSIPPFLLMGARSLLGGLALVLGARWSGSPTASVADWARAAVCGVLFFVTCHGVLAYAQQYVPSGIAALLLATIPFWIALIGTLLPGSKISSARQVLLLIPGFAGVAIIVAGEIGPGLSNFTDLLLLLGAAASWALGTIMSQRWSPQEMAIEYSGMELVAGGVVLLGISLLRREPDSFDIRSVPASAFGGWLYLTVAGTIITFAAYIWLLKRKSPTLVATYTFVNPVIAVILGWAVLGEKVNGSIALGATLVIGSVVGLLLADQSQAACAGKVSIRKTKREVGR
jgi:drug/metabolite transporter (DMT)-like permease